MRRQYQTKLFFFFFHLCACSMVTLRVYFLFFTGPLIAVHHYSHPYKKIDELFSIPTFCKYKMLQTKTKNAREEEKKKRVRTPWTMVLVTFHFFYYNFFFFSKASYIILAYKINPPISLYIITLCSVHYTNINEYPSSAAKLFAAVITKFARNKEKINKTTTTKGILYCSYIAFYN